MNAPVRYAQCAEHYCTIFEGAWQWGGCYFALCRGYAAALLRRMAVYLDSLVLFCTDSALPLGQGGVGVALRSAVALQLLWRRSCAAVGCGSSRVAASGGQGGIGGLRVPPTPSLDSLLTPLYRRRSARGMEAAGRGVLARRSAAGAREVGECCFAFFCCVAASRQHPCAAGGLSMRILRKLSRFERRTRLSGAFLTH